MTEQGTLVSLREREADSERDRAVNGSHNPGGKYEWTIADPIPGELRGQLGDRSVMLAHLLYQRGYHSVDEIDEFFRQEPVHHDPFLLPDMAAAVERISRAAADGEQVAIFGDFDCDGLTSTVALRETLEGLGLSPLVYVPTRDEGHGLQPEKLREAASRGVTLILTADCGVTALTEVELARSLDIEVIVTDHHEPRSDGTLPAGLVVAPTRRDSRYPFRSLCGVGLTYKLAQALSSAHSEIEPEGLLDLVAIGTIADVVPLLDENRSIVIAGLDRLRHTERPGLLALCQVAKIPPSAINPVAISFYLAPRINAANRMAEPQLAYDLLVSTDREVAGKLAAELNAHNEERQRLLEEKFAEVIVPLGIPTALIDEIRAGQRAPLLFVQGDWPPGLSGLLAGRLVELYGVPAFAGSTTPDGTFSVSARGIAGMHVDELLERSNFAYGGSLFLGHGGHSGAGGFRIEADRIDDAIAILQDVSRESVPVAVIGASMQIDAQVKLENLTFEAANKIETLQPFGAGFPEPLFLARRVRVRSIKQLGADGEHCRLSVMQGSSRMDALCFRADEELLGLEEGTDLDIVFHLQLNRWEGYLKPELQLRDWRLASS